MAPSCRGERPDDIVETIDAGTQSTGPELREADEQRRPVILTHHQASGTDDLYEKYVHG